MDTNFCMNFDETFQLGALISGPITGFLINKFGRKQTMLCFAFPFLCGWALIILAQNLVMMGAGRFITGKYIKFMTPHPGTAVRALIWS